MATYVGDESPEEEAKDRLARHERSLCRRYGLNLTELYEGLRMGDFFASDELPSEDLKRLHGEYWGALQSDPEMESALPDHQMLELANPDATSLLHATRNFSAISARYMSRILKQAPSWEKSLERDLDELYQQENAVAGNKESIV